MDGEVLRPFAAEIRRELDEFKALTHRMQQCLRVCEQQTTKAEQAAFAGDLEAALKIYDATKRSRDAAIAELKFALGR
ncbi:hypothetical protein GQ43DRAFT_442487 [Delitschia confertaspora ATCC 74209]|uniref:Uncharacterized protein n=1 Tax=Delitschia confertaspora ATCC 74209 TaxID=1513339 RepID=A0A9P4MQJ8_9PLEO|nr:hypothetical protein GQ43DRAFT_442487 [Delitschia confertaspora ATCC 74209]